jgi:hypothetical protein
MELTPSPVRRNLRVQAKTALAGRWLFFFYYTMFQAKEDDITNTNLNGRGDGRVAMYRPRRHVDK